MPNHLTTTFFGLNNQQEFIKGIQHAVNNLAGGVYIPAIISSPMAET